MVVIQVQGGLGNQLFQIVAGYLLARKNGESRLFLDVSRVPFGTDNSRRLEALNLNLFPSDFSIEVWGEKLYRFTSYFPSRVGAFASITTSKINSKLRFKRHFFFSENVSTKKFEELDANTILHGYFNDFSIVEKAQDLGLKSDLLLSSQPSRWLTNSLETIDFDSNIAIHVRLGDYLKYPQIFGSLSEEYYLSGLDEIGFSKNQPLIIFSDQPNLVANHLPKISRLNNCRIIRSSSAVPSYETLFLMSKFNKIVCANSTFSMWAAWFNQGGEFGKKRVVIPTPYLLDRVDMVTPAAWRKIPRTTSPK